MLDFTAPDQSQSQNELQCLSQTIMTERPSTSELADAVMQQLEDVIALTTEDILVSTDDDDNHTDKQEHEIRAAALSQRSTLTSASSTMMVPTQPYPPLTQVGIVVDHDRPYADYGHLGM